jgi:hypothetical protein
MKRNLLLQTGTLLVAGVLLSTAAWAQASRPSPTETATGTVNGATITIKYSSPAVKGRHIWGGLVPYDKFWRAGANEATIFTTSKNIKFGGVLVHAGSYSLFAKPGAQQWTIILNSQTGQSGIKEKTGEANFDPANNVASVQVTPHKSDSMNERLVYVINGDRFELRWENLAVPVGLK